MERLTEKREYPLTMSMWGGNSKDLNVYNRLAKIEDILGDNYDLSRLRDLVQADRDGRCFVSDVKLGDEVFCIPKYSGKALVGIKKGHVQAVSFTKAGKRVRLREYHEYNKDFMLGKTAFTTREAAEEALKGENNNENH